MLTARPDTPNEARMLFEQAPLPALIVDVETRTIVEANGALTALFGWTRDEFLHMRPEELVVPEQHERLNAARARPLQGPMSVGVYTNLRKDGSRLEVEVTVSPSRREGRDVVIVNLVDVSKRIEAERALVQSEERFRIGFDQACIASVLTDGRGQLLRVNDAFCALVRMRPDELLGKSLLQLVHEDDRAQVMQNFGGMLAGRRGTVNVEKRYTRPDGTYFWAQASAVVLQRENGLPSLAQVELVDLTGMRTVIEALRESEERLAFGLAATSDGLFDLDIETSDLFVSASAERMLGYEPGELPTNMTTWQELVHPDDLPRAVQVLDEHSHGREPSFEFEVRLRQKSGRLITVLERAKVVTCGPDGSAKRIVGTLQDVSERRQLEAKLQQSQRLEGLGVLAGGIAHDFNNLLVGVLANASLAAETLPNDHPAAPLVAEMRAAATRAAELTRELLAYAGKGRFVLEPIDLSVLAREMSVLVGAAMSKQAALHTVLSDSLPRVHGDATQIRQVVMNLLTNASEALDGKPGTVTIRTGVTAVDRSFIARAVGTPDIKPGSYVFVEVQDNGCGMDAATAARIFEPFYTTKFAGRGLGLAATLGIINAHDGAVSVSTKPGVGTTIRAVLPVARVETDHRPTAQESPPAVTPTATLPAVSGPAGQALHWKGQGEVLLADDEELVRTVARRTLERIGFTVVECADGREVVERFHAEPDRWRLVVLDLTMPHLKGDHALQEIRALRPNTPAVLYSGYSEEELDTALVGAGGVQFVQKPFTARTISGAIRLVLDE